MYGRCAGLDHGLDQLEGVQRPPEPGFRVGNDGREPEHIVPALQMADLIGAHERVVDTLHHGRHAVRRVEALIRVGLPCIVGVRGHLPSAQVDRLQAGCHLLNRLEACHGTQGLDVRLGVQQVPQTVGPHPRKRVFEPYGSAKPFNRLGCIFTSDSLEPR